MAHQLVLSTLLSSTQPYDLGTQYTPTSAPSTHTLAISSTELDAVQRRLTTTNAVFGVGMLGATVGVVTAGVGAGIMVVGLIPLVLGAPEVLMAGLYVMGVGAVVAVVSVPVMVGSALLGNAVLRHSGIEVSSVPGLVAVGGLGMIVAGGFLQSDIGGTLGGTGALMMVAGSTIQVIVSNRAFKEYEQGIAGSPGPSLALHPVAALDGYGLGATVRF